jgi:hypothetical protein
MRELCNLSYAAQVQFLEEDELRAFDGRLVAAPGERARNQSRNVGALMDAFALPKAGQ